MYGVFSTNVNMERCTGCNNCVVACPVNALELYSTDPVTKEKIYVVQDGVAISLDFKDEFLCRLRCLRRSLSHGCNYPFRER